jgi:DNA-binding CsgD family transcriptional regulator
MSVASVIGREEELASIEAFLADVEEGPRALVLSGEAGIGKTVLWENGIEEASQSFSRVLTCRGVEAEASLSFAGLSDLLGDALEAVAPSLVSPRRHALEVALLLVEPGEHPPDAHAIGLAVLDLLRILAEAGPVLVAVDDAQWLDPASAGVLQIAFRRLREERVGLLGTARAGSERPGAAVELDGAFPGDRGERISVGPLSAGAAHRLLKERLGLELTRPELARVQEATAGNPFFALEVGREIVRTGTRPAAGRALRVPDSLRELLGGRLGRLPGETLDILLLVASLARPTVEAVAAAHGDRDRVLRGLETAAQEGVVAVEGSQVRFAHPLLLSICYEEAPIWKRRAVHRALAGAVGDVEERARHLALAADGPDAIAASSLEAAAEQAAARGATAVGAELAELAAELTPDDPILERQRRFRAANLFRLAGDVERAVTMLEQLLGEVPHGLERADVLFMLAVCQTGGTRIQAERCDEALIEAASDDARSARILAVRAGYHLLKADAAAALTDARAALERAERAGDSVALAVAIAYAGQAESYFGDTTSGLLERGVEMEDRLALKLEWNYSPRYVLGRRLMRTGEIDRARSILEDFAAGALERGDEVSRIMAVWPLCVLEWLAGRWDRAIEHAVSAYELTEQTQHPHAWTWVGRAKALAEADLGLVADARTSAEEALVHTRASGYEFSNIATLGVLGRLEFALGNLEAAREYLGDLPEQLLAGQMNDPTVPVWADAIETLIVLGEFERAGAYLDRYESNAVRLGSAWALAAAARCRGVFEAGRGNLTGSLAAFDVALTELTGDPFPFERARTLLCLGTVRRRAQQKRGAREALEEALAIFERLGARLWAEKAGAELRRISGRAPASEELTETERRVAELAARGRSNKEIAAELYMGVSTVEAHLSHVYRKLGVRRAELASRIVTSGDGAAKVRDEAAQA